MSKTLDQIFMTNPITSNAATDLMYFVQSPYTVGTDAAMTYANFAAQFGAPYTAAALTEVNDTNVTLTLGGTPATALLHAVSITAGWTGLLGLARGGTNANLSATGGTSQVLRQSTVGGAITVSQLAASDLSNGTTGTGDVVLQTSPTLITPTLGVAKATSIQFPQDGQLLDPNGNVYVTFQEVASAVNNVELGNSATGNAASVSAVGVDTNVTLALNGQGTGGAEVQGTGTNNNAPTGYVGEYQIASLASGSSTSLSNNTAKTIVTLSLTAGDWDVSGSFGINPAASTITQLMACGISLTTNTFASFPDPSFNELAGVATVAGASVSIITGVTRISLAATTNVFLIGFADFTVSTNTGFGIIQARRAR